MGITSETLQARAAAATGRQRAATERTDAQRERILQAAAQLFADQGYANTTMAQIVRALGVTKPFVYYYFRDKQEIFETLSWRPAVECLTVMDFAQDDKRRAVDKVMDGIERLIRATIAHHPCAFFPYREPQVYRPEYQAEALRLAHHFYDRLCPLLEQARRDGDLDFDDTMVTALAACSLPGFLYTWYRPDGRLGVDEMVAMLSGLAWRVLGLRTSTPSHGDPTP
ncbi:MAG: TetR/AcrR family transcriptional regulator [Comamonadaceae bacterium]|nr:MAG: TetR/AcrR family transcriptional regulator [Comamonadaceae bacterium]